MLEVQKYLKNGKTLEDLHDQYGISMNVHPTEPLVILNYGLIEGKRFHPIVRECRGLVLNTRNFELVARSFPRFFNWGENREEAKIFNFSDFKVQTKIDGSLITIYNFQKKWHINTRAAFGDNNFVIEQRKITWQQAILESMGVKTVDDLEGILDPELTYVAEFVSPETRVVRYYPDPELYLLSVYKGEQELSIQEADEVCKKCAGVNLVRPKIHQMYSVQEIELFLNKMASTDPSFEGVVIRDVKNNRWKLKNVAYLSLHHLNSQGQLHRLKNMAQFVITPEWEEQRLYILKNFPELENCFNECRFIVIDAYDLLKEVWEQNCDIDIKDQKKFALNILDETPFSSILFTTRKKHGLNQDEEHLLEEWYNSKDLIIKTLFK